MTELDPVTIRRELQHQRNNGIQFADAWMIAAGPLPERTPEMSHADAAEAQALYKFMLKHFRAAYYDTEAPEGRCNVPGRDVSAAVGLPHAAAFQTDHERCRSGDGCDRLATCGRFGRMWCDYHGAELERLSEKFSDELTRADPRNGGNTTLYTHRAA